MKSAFFYCIGTSYLVNLMTPLTGTIFSVDMDMVVKFGNSTVNPRVFVPISVRGLNGEKFSWDGTPIDDPFPKLLSKDLWDIQEKVEYPAVVLPGSVSIEYGRLALIAKIQALPKGKKFAFGGYSQGAAVCSSVYMSGLKPGTTGPLESRRSDFLGATLFGNPRRQTNHRGANGAFGTWSGSFYIPSQTSGSGGAFPDTGPLGRLTGCEEKWVEFTAPKEIVAAVGTSDFENFARFLGGLSLGTVDIAGFIKAVMKDGVFDVIQMIQGLFGNDAGSFNYFIDADGNPRSIGGGGHTSYSIFPPPNSSGVHPTTTQVIGDNTYHTPVGSTMYQCAAQWLNDQAELYVDDPVIAPPPPVVNYGWSTTLSPPV